MASDGRISNALGVPLPQWIIKQLDKRSQELSVSDKTTDNVLFRANRSSWIRLVSSVDLIQPNYKNTVPGTTSTEELNSLGATNYFQSLGINVKDPSDLAKLFVLQGGVSKYQQNGNSFSYNHLSGFEQVYNVTNTQKEISEYGYRPMPGLTSARITTQGKLGSIRAAEIQIKVWDKTQLDIIDALYFKLGYTMFLEWGHTSFYRAGSDVMEWGEQYSVNPFDKNIMTKEDIQNVIAKNVRDSEGNYDAMLGMVTNFNFSYNNEGGYDCTIKLISLGVLISSTKMNNPRVLPDVQDKIVKRLVNTLTEIDKQRIAKEKAAADSIAKSDPSLASSYPPCIRKIGNPTQKKEGGPYAIRYTTDLKIAGLSIKESISFYNNGKAVYSSGEKVSYSCDGDTLIINGEKASISGKDFKKKYITYDETQKVYRGGQISYASNVSKRYENIDFSANTGGLGWVYFINKLNGYIPIDSDKIGKSLLLLDGKNINSLLSNIFKDDKKWEFNQNVVENLKTIVTHKPDKWWEIPVLGLEAVAKIIDYGISAAQGSEPVYLMKANATTYATNLLTSKNGNSYVTTIERHLYGRTDKTNVEDQYSYITLNEFSQAIQQIFLDSGKKYNIKNISPRPDKISIEIPIRVPITKKVKVIVTEPKADGYGQKIAPKTTEADVVFYVDTVLTIQDSALIRGVEILDTSIQEPSDFVGVISDQKDQNKPKDEEPLAEESNPALDVSTIQTSESVKYRSAFEVMIRTIQLYSLDQSISKGIETDRIVHETNFLEKSIYEEFTKNLFSKGLFSSVIDQIYSPPKNLRALCEYYDKEMLSGTVSDRDKMFLVRAWFGFHFGLMGNKSGDTKTLATDLFDQNLFVNYDYLFKTYTVPYQFNVGVFEGTQLNHPVYVPFGLVMMILNHACLIYDSKGPTKSDRPMFYIDFNNKTNLCLSNAKQFSTNPYDILIPIEGSNKDFESVIEPTVIGYDKSGKAFIRGTTDNPQPTAIFTPRGEDLISGFLPPYRYSGSPIENYRGRTMNVLVSCDYILKVVENFSKNNGSGDIYVREFIEQVLFDINKSLGDINIFRLAYDDGANTAYVVDDQLCPNLEKNFVDSENKSKLPLFGKGSIAKTLEIRSEVSSKLSNMLAISANSEMGNMSSLSKSADSYGFYNVQYKDRYIPNRTEITSSIELPTNAMINSSIQFNNAIKTFYSDASPAVSSVGHATNYYIERMSRIKTSDKATRASAMIPVSLNFSIDGISGVGMGHAFTISDQFLPYTYNLSLTDPYGEKDQTNTVGFVMVGLDQTIENNQWTSNVRANMIYLKKMADFMGAESIEKLKAPTGAFTSTSTSTGGVTADTNFVGSNSEAKSAADSFLGRSLTDKEWSELVSATFAEASANQTERAYVMGVILNRTRSGNWGNTIHEVLTAKNQFQSVTGTSKDPGPSINFVNGPTAAAATSIYGAAKNLLKEVPKSYLYFTAANIKAYTEGTNPKFRQTLLDKGGVQIGQTIFSP